MVSESYISLDKSAKVYMIIEKTQVFLVEDVNQDIRLIFQPDNVSGGDYLIDMA